MKAKFKRYGTHFINSKRYRKKQALDKAGKPVCDNWDYNECAEEATHFSRDYFTGKIDSKLCEACAEKAYDQGMESLIESLS